MIAMKDIPGFYYDEKKKKYFKIESPNSGCHSHSRESLQYRDNEEKRQKRLKQKSKEQPLPKPPKPKSSVNFSKIQVCAKGNVSKDISVNSFPRVLDMLKTGCVSYKRIQCYYNNWHISNLNPVTKSKVLKSTTASLVKLEHMQSMTPNSDYTKLLCLWSMKNKLWQRIQLLDVAYDRGKQLLNIDTSCNAICGSFSKIVNVVWAPQADGRLDYVMYSTMSVIGNGTSMVRLAKVTDDPPDPSDQFYRFTEFNLGNKAIWSSCWNKHLLKFSVGSEKCSFLVDVHSRKMWQLYTQQSDVLSQVFSTETGNLLISGTRSGSVLFHDVRSSSTRHVMHIRHPIGVCHLHLMTDNNYLIASDFTAKIKHWDLRIRKPVISYNGNVNSYSNLPFYVNEESNVLYAAGQDCYSRIWDLKGGQLLCTIPPPYPASLDNIPTLCYSQTMGVNCFSGLLMGILDELHLYSTPCDE